MDKNTFFAMTPKERVTKVNKLLEEYDMKGISDLLGISSSKFSQTMREGDYIYHKADKKYYPFVRSEEEREKNSQSVNDNEIDFIKHNVDTLKKVIKQFEEQGLLLLDKRIYSRDAKFVNKSIRMNSDIYEEFSSFCEEYYPHLKTQDLIAQSLIDAMTKYKPDRER
ncbi:hypothetical protein MHI02_05780 [Oceanobacillus sp. FSL K6-0118]|uniref:hypothetical protein n=1 Tax=Oceanobacillus sp. FSL K6-0118 TaxID=2921418 RepID=UPI0030FC976F